MELRPKSRSEAKSHPEPKSSPEYDLFHRLKRHFVLNAALLSAGVIIVAFAMIYVVVSRSFSSRRPVEVNFRFRGIEVIETPPPNTQNGQNDQNSQSSQDDQTLNDQIRNEFENRIKADREKSLETLLLTLIITGIGIEIIVIIASLFAAENAIKPVRDAYKTQKDFISNASHELKTPLAVIQANLEAADIQGNHWLDNAMQKVEEATELNNSLLALARMDQITATPGKKSNINLEKLIHKTADFYQPKLTEKGITLEFSTIPAKTPNTDNPSAKPSKSTQKSPEVLASRAELTQLLNILLDNAVKYADKSIKISLEAPAKISIKNDGATIEKSQLPHIFDRFYQVDKSKSGVGLGLAIAKTLADRNGWKITANSNTKTTTFTIDLRTK